VRLDIHQKEPSPDEAALLGTNRNRTGRTRDTHRGSTFRPLSSARLSDDRAAAYLEHLGVVVARGEVDASTLAAIQRAHVTRVPYENVDLYRRRPPGIDPLASVERILAGRGGYCYHLNGALAALLDWLGVDVTRHVSGVQGSAASAAPGPNANHLGVTARTPDGAEWLVDAGLGDGPLEPLPLAFGAHEQGGFTYSLGPSAFDPDGWRLEHDPRGAFVGADFARAPAETAQFLEMHRELSTSPTSGFVRVCTILRRTTGGVEILRGCVRSTITPEGRVDVDVDAGDAWWEIVIDDFGLAYGDLPADERERVWARVLAGHREWDAAGRP
jgi:arylamine N-acetyltransferase